MRTGESSAAIVAKLLRTSRAICVFIIRLYEKDSLPGTDVKPIFLPSLSLQVVPLLSVRQPFSPNLYKSFSSRFPAAKIAINSINTATISVSQIDRFNFNESRIEVINLTLFRED